MTRIVVEENCGNAPKKGFLKDFYIAIANCDTAFVRAWLSPDATWTLVGEQTVLGPEEIARAIVPPPESVPDQLVIETIITHGNVAAVNGTMSMNDGTRYAYCEIYKFAGFGKTAKIKSITSYVIQTA